MTNDLERAVGLLGPLEGRIMRGIWSRQVPDRFVIRDIHALMPDLAYTTVMTTVHRLADKGLVCVQELPTERRAHVYRAACSPSEQLARASRQEVEAVLERYGEAALAAFADRLDGMSPARRRRLQRLAGR